RRDPEPCRARRTTATALATRPVRVLPFGGSVTRGAPRDGTLLERNRLNLMGVVPGVRPMRAGIDPSTLNITSKKGPVDEPVQPHDQDPGGPLGRCPGVLRGW